MTALTDRLPARLAGNPLHAMRSDSDIEAVADALASAAFPDGEEFFKASGKLLLTACLGYLRDWCRLEQRTPGNLEALLRAAVPEEGHQRSDLDNRFYEIESGCRRVTGADGTEVWEASALERNDGTRPRDTNGIRPADDFSLGAYRRFAQSATAATRADIARSLLVFVTAQAD